MEENKQAVPKFSSFKPRPKPEPTPEWERKRERGSRNELRVRDDSVKHRRHRERDRDHGSEPHRRHDEDRRHRHDKEHHHHHHRRDREERVSLSSSRSRRDASAHYTHRAEKPTSTSTSTGLSISGDEHDADLPWKIDPTGDKFNTIYGSLHKYAVPHFYRTGHGMILGLPPHLRIDRDAEVDEKTIAVRSTYGDGDGDGGAGRGVSSRREERDAAWRRARRITRTYRVSGAQPVAAMVDELDQDFVSVVDHYQQPASKRRRVDGGRMSASPDEIDYRSIEGRAKPAAASDYGLEEYEEGAAADEAGREEAARRENAELFKLVDQRPNDVDTWLRCIDFQETFFGTLDAYGHRRLTPADKRALADIRMSLYEKALRAVSASVAKDRLIIGMLEEGAGLWDTKTLSKKWVEVLQAYPYSMMLWVKYLNFQQTHFLTFSYGRLEAFFVECLRLNQSSLDKAPDDEAKRHVLAIHVYLLLRMTLFMREAGYLELATATWQALLEFNFCRPERSALPRDWADAVASFESWWQSEAPRIGDAGAKHWDSTSESAAPKKITDAMPPPVDLAEAPFSSWERAERQLMQQSFVPARALDDVSIDDPYRVILFADVAGYLCDFAQAGLLELLLDAFLIFCRLPPIRMGEHASVVAEWQTDPLIYNDLLDSDHDCSRWFSSKEKEEEKEGDQRSSTPQPYDIPFLNFSVHTDVSFATDTWFSSFRLWKHRFADTPSILDTDWIRRALKQLVFRCPNNTPLAEYAIALDLQIKPKLAKQTAKTLLKMRSANVRLYNAYTLTELVSGERAVAEQVLASTLNMSERFPPREKVNRALLWRTWLWEYFARCEMDHVLQLFLFMAQESAVDTRILANSSSLTTLEIPSTTVLKVKQMLSSVQDYGLSNNDADVLTAATDCMAIFSYILNDRDILEALAVYRAISSRIQQQHKSQGQTSSSSSVTLELLYQTKARLLYHHTLTSRLYSPAQLRAELVHAVEVFPSNTIFLSLFAWNEARFRIEDRVRAVVKKYSSNASSSSHGDGGAKGNNSPSSKLITHLFGIYTELHRGVSAGSTAHSVRSAFEDALSFATDTQTHTARPRSSAATSSSSSALLWKLYVLFELSQPDPRRARDVYYRAIQACPWAKKLVLLCLHHEVLRRLVMTRGSLDTPTATVGDPATTTTTTTTTNKETETETSGTGRQELARIWNVLAEREIRTHIDLEAWFERNGLDLMDTQTGGDDDGVIALPRDEDSGDDDDDDDGDGDGDVAMR